MSTEVVEPVMPATLALPALFNIRPVYMVTEDEDDRLSNIYWLSTPMGDESDHEQDLVWAVLRVWSKTDVKGELNVDKKWQSDDLFYIIMNKIRPCVDQF